MPRFKYDAFISYRHQDPDQSWVKKILVPRLDTEGFKVLVDYRDFRPGSALITEMVQGVIQSKRTVCILSPAYLKSEFTDLESMMAEQLGMEKRQRRFLAIMRVNCNPRLSIKIKIWIDMTKDTEFDAKFDELAAELRRPLKK
jgi:hypothetical protein